MYEQEKMERKKKIILNIGFCWLIWTEYEWLQRVAYVRQTDSYAYLPAAFYIFCVKLNLLILEVYQKKEEVVMGSIFTLYPWKQIRSGLTSFG